MVWLKRSAALLLCLFLLGSTLAEAVPTAVSPLPWDDTPGYPPNPDDYTETGYNDASIRVEITPYRSDGANYYVAQVDIQHASQLRTGLPAILKRNSAKITAMAKAYYAVLAVNGDDYTQRKTGLTIRQGVTLRAKTSPLYDVLLIDGSGDFHIVKRDNLAMLDAYLSGDWDIRNVFSFGPALVMDGAEQTIPEHYSFAPLYKNPRAAIGQFGPLSYVCVIVDGRSETSAGVTLQELAHFMAGLGCKQAFNLDGGNSATLVLNGQIYNSKSAGNERSVSDILYFATTVNPLNR